MKSTTLRASLGRAVPLVILTIYAMIALFPIVMIIMNSFKVRKAIFGAPFEFPNSDTFSLIGYETVTERAAFSAYYRQPFGATLTILALGAGKWIAVYTSWWWWSNYPPNFVMPATVIPSALVLDIVLLLTRNWTLTAVIGAWMFAILFYPSNWPIFGYSHTPIVVDGTLLSWADYMGFMYVRTGTPEYIRMIEIGSLRTFGGHSTMISAFFAAFASSLMYILWWQFGKFFCTAYFDFTDERQKVTKVHDGFAYATLAHADKAKSGGKA